MDIKEDLLVHYWELPNDIFISLKEEFHNKICDLAQKETNYYFKNCFYKILNCPKYHAQRLFNRDIRFNLKEFEILRKRLNISKEEIEKNIETMGNHEDGTIIKNPNLPFNLKDIFYIASHLFFDGSFRLKKGCYFYSYDEGLLNYHKKRLNNFGDVPMNFIEKENQLYFSYTLGYIAKSLLDIKTFKSTSCFLSEKFKLLAKKHKLLTDEVVKALIIDEGSIEDKIKIELCNEKLVKDLYEIISLFYKLKNIYSRKRIIYFKGNPKWNYNSTSWALIFSYENIKELYNSISPLPIDYKENTLKLLYRRKIRKWNQRKTNETKKLIIKSLLIKPKTVSELADELCIRNGTILFHLNGHPTYSSALINLGIIKKIGSTELKKGGYTKVNIYGIDDQEKAKEYLEKIFYKLL